MAPETAPPQLDRLRARLAEIADLEYAGALLAWDQSVWMPPGGAGARAEQLATLERLVHARLTDPEHGRLLHALEPWVAGLDPDADEARLVAVSRRDLEKAVRVPEALAVEMARESARGYTAWVQARESGNFARFHDPLSRQIELGRRYAACLPDAEHPYDVLLDDFEPGMTTAEVKPLFDVLLPALTTLVAEAAGDDNGPPLHDAASLGMHESCTSGCASSSSSRCSRAAWRSTGSRTRSTRGCGGCSASTSPPTRTASCRTCTGRRAKLRAEEPQLDDAIRAGDFAPLRDWLREHVHRHGRKLSQRELLRRATGDELSAQPLLHYLRAKLADAGVTT